MFPFIHNYLFFIIAYESQTKFFILNSSFFIYFSHLSSHSKKVRCQRTPFWGWSTQWFSSG